MRWIRRIVVPIYCGISHWDRILECATPPLPVFFVGLLGGCAVVKVMPLFRKCYRLALPIIVSVHARATKLALWWVDVDFSAWGVDKDALSQHRGAASDRPSAKVT